MVRVRVCRQDLLDGKHSCKAAQESERDGVCGYWAIRGRDALDSSAQCERCQTRHGQVTQANALWDDNAEPSTEQQPDAERR